MPDDDSAWLTALYNPIPNISGGGKGSTTVVDTNTQYTNTVNTNTSYAGNSGIAGNTGEVNVTTNNSSTTNTVLSDSGALDLAGRITRDAFTTTNNSLLLVDNTLDLLHSEHVADFNALSDLATYNYNSLSGVIGSLTGSLSGAVSAIRQDNNSALQFFAGQTDNLLRASNSNVDKLVDQTLKAVKTTSDAAQSQDAQQLTQLQSTLIKLALGMGVVIVTVAYFARRKG
jgi:hypothetical protein